MHQFQISFQFLKGYNYYFLMIVQNRDSALHRQMALKIKQFQKCYYQSQSPPASPTFKTQSNQQYTHASLILNGSELQKFKTQPCKCISMPHQLPDGQNSLIHHCTEYPYYYQCQFYHSERDQRRNPYKRIKYQQKSGVSPAKTEQLMYSYSALYFGDRYSKEMCDNWIQYLFHPAIYKSLPCDAIKCQRKYCPKLHKGQKKQEKISVLDANQKKNIASTEQSIQKIRRIKQINEIEYKEITKQNQSTDKVLCKQIFETKEGIYSHLQKINKYEEQQVNKVGYLRDQILHLAGGANGKQDSMNISATVKSQDDYDRLFFQEQLKIVEDRQHEFKMFKDKDPHRISALVLEYISAFLNSDGGSIYLGINDESIVHGIEVDQKWLDKFKLAVDSDGRNHLTPPLIPQKYSLRIIPVNHSKKLDLKVIQIKVFSQPQCDKKILTLYKKQCYLRMNASNHRLSASDIMEYMRLVNSNSNSNSNTNANTINTSNPNMALISPIKKQLQNIQKIEQKVDELSNKQLKQLQQHINKINIKISASLRKKQVGEKGKQKQKQKYTERVRSKQKIRSKQKNKFKNGSSSQEQL